MKNLYFCGNGTSFSTPMEGYIELLLTPFIPSPGVWRILSPLEMKKERTMKCTQGNGNEEYWYYTLERCEIVDMLS